MINKRFSLLYRAVPLLLASNIVFALMPDPIFPGKKQVKICNHVGAQLYVQNGDPTKIWQPLLSSNHYHYGDNLCLDAYKPILMDGDCIDLSHISRWYCSYAFSTTNDRAADQVWVHADGMGYRYIKGDSNLVADGSGSTVSLGARR